MKSRSLTVALERAIDPSSVHPDGRLTRPRSYGVYCVRGVQPYRFGNHPVRLRELEREFGSCTLEHLFASREDAKHVSDVLNASNATAIQEATR